MTTKFVLYFYLVCLKMCGKKNLVQYGVRLIWKKPNRGTCHRNNSETSKSVCKHVVWTFLRHCDNIVISAVCNSLFILWNVHLIWFSCGLHSNCNLRTNVVNYVKKHRRICCYFVQLAAIYYWSRKVQIAYDFRVVHAHISVIYHEWWNRVTIQN